MFSHGFPTPSRFGSDAPKAKLTTAAFAHGIPSSWHHVRQQHGRKPVRGPVRTFLRMLFHDMDTANYTSDSLSDLRPTYSPLPTTPRPSSTLLWRLSPPPSRRQPLSPPSPRPLHPPSTFPLPLHRLAIQTSPGPSTRPLSPNTNRVQPWRRSLRHHPRRGVRPAQGHNAHRVYSANGHRGTRHRSRPPPPLHARTVEQLVVASPRPRRRSPHRCRKVDAGISVCCWTTQPNPTTAPRPGRPRPPCSHAGGRLDHQTSSHEATHQQDLRLPYLPPTHHYGRSGLRGHHTPASLLTHTTNSPSRLHPPPSPPHPPHPTNAQPIHLRPPSWTSA